MLRSVFSKIISEDICCLYSIQLKCVVSMCIKCCGSVVASASLSHVVDMGSYPVINIVFFTVKQYNGKRENGLPRPKITATSH